MNQCVKKQHDKIRAKRVGKQSIEAAVEYLINECVRTNDTKSATVLSLALKDLKSQKPSITEDLDNDDDEKVIGLLREILRLEKSELLELIHTLEKADYIQYEH